MVDYERSQKSTLVARLNEEPVRLILVTGPRQTGKTTLVKQVLRHIDRPCRYLAVDEPDPVTFSPAPGDEDDPEARESGPIEPRTGGRDERWLVRRWEEARIDAERSERGFVLVFDEVQKIANWSEPVKGLWDADRHHARNLHVVLVSSVPLALQRSLTESLAGRFETIRFTHWSFVEMSEAFGVDLPGFVYFGGYPGAAAIAHDQERWSEYITVAVIEPNIERDVLAMQRVDRPALLKGVFELGAGYSGQVLSFARMLDHLQDAGNTTTLARYLDLLSRSGLVTGLPNHATHAHRARASSPKLNVLNTALMSVGSGYTFEEAQTDRSWWGRLVESAVGAHLYNTGTPSLGLRYWRYGGREVDFVLERGRRLVTFEVRSGTRRVKPSGLREFRARFDVERSVLVGEGGVPLSEFLSIPARYWFERS